MKITSQSSNELVLQEGSAQGVILGAIFVAAGVLAWYLFRQSSPMVIWFALAFAVIGIGTILFSSSITVVANRATGQLSYQKKRLIGGQNSTFAVADIFRIETRKQWRVDRTPPPPNPDGSMQQQSVAQPMLVAQSVIVFKDGREVPLDHQKTSSSMTVGSAVVMGGQGRETAMAAQVAQFLNVPFQEIMPPNMSSGTNVIIS